MCLSDFCGHREPLAESSWAGDPLGLQRQTRACLTGVSEGLWDDGFISSEGTGSGWTPCALVPGSGRGSGLG